MATSDPTVTAILLEADQKAARDARYAARKVAKKETPSRLLIMLQPGAGKKQAGRPEGRPLIAAVDRLARYLGPPSSIPALKGYIGPATGTAERASAGHACGPVREPRPNAVSGTSQRPRPVARTRCKRFEDARLPPRRHGRGVRSAVTAHFEPPNRRVLTPREKLSSVTL